MSEPDYYALLGLPGGAAVEPAEVESRVMALMEQLRERQLLEPEKVTEQLNRLAQASVCLCDPEAKRAYDQAHGYIAAQAPAESSSVVLMAIPVLASKPRPQTVVSKPAEPVISSLSRLRLAAEVRRSRYRHLVQCRRARRLWLRVGMHLGDSSRPLHPAEVPHFAAQMQELTKSFRELNSVIGQPGKPGHTIALIAGQSMVAQTFRGLLPSQRHSLAADWQAGLRVLEQQIRLTRKELRLDRGRNRRWRRRFVRQVLWNNPEWLLLVAACLALGIAAWRG